MNGDTDKASVSSDEETKGDESSQQPPKEEARTIVWDEYKQNLYEEDIKLRKLKRILLLFAVGSAILVHLIILVVALSGLIINDNFWAFSTAVISFVVIYGIIIRNLSSASQQDNNASGLVEKYLGKNAVKFIQKFLHD